MERKHFLRFSGPSFTPAIPDSCMPGGMGGPGILAWCFPPSPAFPSQTAPFLTVLGPAPHICQESVEGTWLWRCCKTPQQLFHNTSHFCSIWRHRKGWRMNRQKESPLNDHAKSRGHILGLNDIFGLLSRFQGLFPSETSALPRAQRVWLVPELRGNSCGFAHPLCNPLCSAVPSSPASYQLLCATQTLFYVTHIGKSKQNWRFSQFIGRHVGLTALLQGLDY